MTMSQQTSVTGKLYLPGQGDENPQKSGSQFIVEILNKDDVSEMLTDTSPRAQQYEAIDPAITVEEHPMKNCVAQ